jgi:hypothetical protein
VLDQAPNCLASWLTACRRSSGQDTGCNIAGRKPMLKRARAASSAGDFLPKSPWQQGRYCSVAGFGAKSSNLRGTPRTLREAKPHRHDAPVYMRRWSARLDGVVGLGGHRIQQVTAWRRGSALPIPYRLRNVKHVKRVLAWSKKNTPGLNARLPVVGVLVSSSQFRSYATGSRRILDFVIKTVQPPAPCWTMRSS